MPFAQRAATFAAGAVVLLLGSNGCYHDNASPFAHGAHNAPPAIGSTSVKAGSEMHMTETTGTSAYGNSSGYSGGVTKETGGGTPETGGAGGNTANAPNAVTTTSTATP